MSDKSCPEVSRCVFFNSISLPGSAKALKAMYCQGDYISCKRYKQLISGQQVPDNLWPDGTLKTPVS